MPDDTTVMNRPDPEDEAAPEEGGVGQDDAGEQGGEEGDGGDSDE